MRIVAEKNADGVFFLSDLALQIGDRSIGRIEDLLGLKNVELGRDAMVDAKIGELNRVFLSFDGFVGDLELKVKLEKREIVAGQVTDQGQYDSLPGVFSGQELSA